MKHILVKAEWDPEAAVWVAESDDVRGLITEADTLEALRMKLRVVIAEFMALDGEGNDPYALDIIARSLERVSPLAA
jgi:predicted RNase H-like HicB family nuclease